MLFYPSGYPKPVRVQGSFVSDKEVQDVVDYLINKNGNASYNDELEEHINTNMPAAGTASAPEGGEDRKSTRLNSSHVSISYAVFCLKKKTRRPSRSGRQHSQ